MKQIELDSEIYIKLKEAELEAKATKIRYSAEEVFTDIKVDLDNYLKADE